MFLSCVPLSAICIVLLLASFMPSHVFVPLQSRPVQQMDHVASLDTRATAQSTQKPQAFSIVVATAYWVNSAMTAMSRSYSLGGRRHEKSFGRASDSISSMRRVWYQHMEV